MKELEKEQIKCDSCGELYGDSFFERWEHVIKNHMERKQ